MKSKKKYAFAAAFALCSGLFSQQYAPDPFRPAKKSPVDGKNRTEKTAPVFQDDDMVLLADGGAEFMLGEDVQAFPVQRTLTSFYINRYETTYSLWYKVRIQAEAMGYAFLNPGQEGSFGRRGKEPADEDARLPVTMINWYDALVWCNAYSEVQGLTPCYTFKGATIKDSSNTAACDLAVCDWQADGYRLPSEAEWEYAARKTKAGMQAGNRASGDFLRGKQAGAERAAWLASNTDEAMGVGTAGTGKEADAAARPGSGNANGAGLFDMSGNVLEFCWDWYADYGEKDYGVYGPEYGSRRVSRGGSWSEYTVFYYAADRYFFDPNEYYNYTGFRFARTAR
ncbi:MAG: formylglycine-generating enzyme family protein [Treponema sp.]